MATKIWFVTGNEHKARIFQEMMGPEFEIEQLAPREDIREKRAREVREVVADKLGTARQMFAEKKGVLFVTDVGLYIEGLDGKPGALIKRETEERFDGDFAQWCDALENGDSREATVRMIIGAASPDNRFFVEHSLDGCIPRQPQEGGRGFAWDKIFVPDWQQYGKDLNNRSLDQAPPEDKFDVLMQPAVNQFKRELPQHLQS